ncbi:hypothetical protein [Sharpea azabuensis]
MYKGVDVVFSIREHLLVEELKFINNQAFIGSREEKEIFLRMVFEAHQQNISPFIQCFYS